MNELKVGDKVRFQVNESPPNTPLHQATYVSRVGVVESVREVYMGGPTYGIRSEGKLYGDIVPCLIAKGGC